MHGFVGPHIKAALWHLGEQSPFPLHECLHGLHDLGMHLNVHALDLAALKHLQRLFAELVENRIGVEHFGFPIAVGTGTFEGIPNAAAGLFSGKLHQPQVGKAEHMRADMILLHGVLQSLKHQIPICFPIHVDKVDDDDAADIPEPQLHGDLLRRLAVGVGDGALQIVFPYILARVYIDDGHSLRPVYDQIAAALEPHLPGQRLFYLGLGIVAIKESLAVLKQDTGLELGRNYMGDVPLFIKGLLVVD